jgi:plastocyanin
MGAVAALAASVLLLPGGAPGHPGHGNQVVNLANTQFTPASYSIYEGDVVVWSWAGPDTNHSVTADPGQAEQFDSDPTGPPTSESHPVGSSFTHVVRRAGRYTYFCKVHPTMRGSVEVKKLDASRPQISAIRVKPRRFCRRCRRPVLEVAVSEDVNVSGELERRKRGRWRPVRTIGQMFFPAGRRRKPISIGGLRPGRYRLVLAARDATGNSSKVHRVPFTVRPRRR